MRRREKRKRGKIGNEVQSEKENDKNLSHNYQKMT